MTEKGSSLFREEVFEARRERLHGHVVIKQSVSAILVSIVLVVIILMAAVWVSLGQYSRIEKVQGILGTTVPSSKVVASKPGVLKGVMAQEGEFVQKGDVLAIVDVDQRAEDGSSYSTASLRSIDRRIEIATDQVQLSERISKSQNSKTRQQIASLQIEISAIERQILLQQEVVNSNQSLFEKIEQLVDRGFVSKLDYEARRQNLLNSQQSLSRLEQQLITKRSDLNRVNADIVQDRLSVSREINNIGNLVENLNQQRATFNGEKSYRIVAPISGQITAVQASVGKPVLPNVALFTIIPNGSDLVATLYAPTRAIGFVKKGQETKLLLDAFPYKRFGGFQATISEVSRTVLDPRETDAPFEIKEPVYKVKAVLRNQSVDAFGEKVPLQPGMTLTGNIILERQSFLDWILEPLRAVSNRT